MVTDTVETIVKSYGVSPLRGVLSHDVQKGYIDGPSVISNVNNSDDKVHTFDIESNTVFALDVVVSGNKEEGKNKYSEMKTTVYKKDPEVHTDLKSKVSRNLINDVHSKFGDFAFSLNDFEDTNQAKMGVNECLKTSHLQPYEVLEEKNGQDVAHFKWTVGVMGGRNIIFASHRETSWNLTDVKIEGEGKEKI